VNPEHILRIADREFDQLRSPVMVVALSGWFDVAGTASAALGGLIESRSAVTVAEIDPDPFYDFTQERPVLTVDNAISVALEWPVNRFDLTRGEGRDIIVMIGVEPHLHWRAYVDCIVEVAQRLSCEAVVTLGAAAAASPHTRLPPVTGSTTHADLAQRLGLGSPSYQGITGVVGVLQAALDSVAIPAVSLRVDIPHYLMSAEHPQAASALGAHLAHVLGVPDESDRRAEIDRWRVVHDEAVENDPQLRMYVRMLEQEFDRRAEASIPTAEDLGAQFEEFLREQRDED